jgi:hypothetical protein
MKGQVGMEGDDADAREEETGRGAASDAAEGDECGDMTFMGEGVLVTVVRSMGSEGRVGKGETVIAGREGQAMTPATLDIADRSHLWLKG